MGEEARIHVMPKEFWGGKTILPAEQKPASLPAPLPIAAVGPVPKPPVHPEKDSRRKLLFLGGGALLFAVLATGGWYAWSLSRQQPVVETPQTTPPVATKPPETTPPVTKPVETTPTKPISGKDTDSDGLTDTEERLYGTDARNPDSDADSFLDGNEVFHRYDPLGPAPQTLLDTGTVTIFTGGDKTWTVYYPMKWTVASEGTSVTFSSTSTAQISVSVGEKIDATQTLVDWYRATLGKNASSDIKSLMTKNGYQELLSNDKLTVYVEAGTSVYVFTYDLKEEKSIDYLTTFQMMVNSFLLTQ